MDTVSSYISFCVDNIVPSKTVTIFPNNKPCITKELKEILNRKTRIFFTGSELEIKKVNKEVKRAIKIAKLRYKNKVEQKLIDGNLRSAWQGLNTMASINTGDINPRTIRVEGSSSTSLPDDLNSFYTRFESDNSIQLEVIRSELNPDNSAFTFSTQDLLRALRRTREWSSPGPHNISGHVLRHCAQQLQDVFQVLFQRSMESSTVPQLWKHSSPSAYIQVPPQTFKSLPRPPFGKSDHSSVLLLPAYRQKLKREAPALRTVHCWSDQSDAILQDCFDHVDWDMFRAASDDDIEAYSDTVTCFIRKCIDDVVPTKTIRIYPNQKPWINSDVRSALSARTSAFKSGNTDDRKQASYDLRRSIKAAKRTYKNKVEEHFNNNNPRSMWQGINNITGFKGSKPATVNIAASLPDELNTFYARFEADNTAHTESAAAAAAEEVSPLTLSVADVTRSFKRVNIRKAVGPDGIPGRVLKACAFQLAGVFTDIFNLSLSLSVVPSCFKKSIIVPIPKKNKITCLNDWRPVALTPIFSKCFEKLIRDYICSVLSASLDPLQFAYRSNRSTDDAIAFTLHTALSHLENKNTYVRMLFVDYSSAFNTIVPATLVAKLQTLGLNRSLCSWILDFLTGRSQVVRMGNNTSSPLILNTGAPQGCVLSPLLYSLYTHDCTATHSSNVIVKFADDTTVIGLITDNDETAYREEVSTLTKWCQENHLSLNIDKTKELVVDYRRQSREHTPITIDKTPVERVTSFKFLGVHITEDLTWSAHTDAVLKKAHQRLFFLRRLRKFGTSPRILRSFYTCTVESILTGCITAWYGNSTAGNRRALQRVVRTARHIVGGELPSLQDIYTRRCTRKARRIIKDSSHPSHSLLSLLPSGRRFRSIRSRTSRLRDSFFPQAIRLMNSHK